MEQKTLFTKQGAGERLRVEGGDGNGVRRVRVTRPEKRKSVQG